MNRYVAALQRAMPDFVVDEMFADLPHMIYGDFGEQLAHELEASTLSDFARRAIAFLNSVFATGDLSYHDLIATAVFEQLVDHPNAASQALKLLDDAPRAAFIHIASWANPSVIPEEIDTKDE